MFLKTPPAIHTLAPHTSILVHTHAQGFACSPGRNGVAEGPARVITSLATQASTVQPGDIIVATYTSPAWTPLFSLVVGILLEDGGMLSHGAVVARECGIPAVTQIQDATVAIKTGDIIRVDGEAGTVTILSLAEEEE
jgi:pyruvate,water dikinase